MDIFNEILWPQFVQLNDIKGLPLNEQVIRYNQYLNELAYNRKCYLQQINWLDCNKGSKKIKPIGFLLQEDLFDLEQENGSKILITEYA